MLSGLIFPQDRAIRGFEGGRRLLTSCGRALFKGAVVGWIYPRSSRSPRLSILFGFRSVGMGRRHVVVQEPQREHPAWHV